MNRHARFAGVIVAAIGSIGLAGWLLDIDRLTHSSPDRVSMKFGTAVSLVLLGITLAAGAHTRLAAGATAVVGMIAAIVLVEYSTGWTSGLDRLFVHDPTVALDRPGRMSATTAVCLGLGVVAVIGIRRHRVRVVTGASRVIFLLGWLGCVGYLFGVRALYDLGPFEAMAGQTAAALLVLSLGLLLSCPDGPLSRVFYADGPGAAVLRRTLPLAVFGLPVFAALCLAGQRADLYGVEAGLAILVLGSAMLVILVAVSSARIVARLNEAAALANELLQATNAGLEASVVQRTEALAASEARARALADSAPVGIFHLDSEGRGTYVNRRWSDVVGRSADEALGVDWTTWVHPEDRAGLVNAWTKATQQVADVDAEFRIVRPSGTVRWVRVHGTADTQGDGEHRAMIATMDDITSRVEAMQARREAEAMFTTTFESSPIGKAILDRDGLIARANPAFATMCGQRADELVGQSIQSLLDPDDDYRTADADHEQRDHRLHQRGGIRWVSIHTARVEPTSPQEFPLEIVQFVDTTARVELERRLADMAEHDPLTGLRNRRSFEAALTQHAARCRREGATGSILLLDLDHFKPVNDTFGHEAGDRALIAISRILVQSVRKSDVVARLGGDEFAVLLSGGGPAEAKIVADGLIERVREASLTNPDELHSITTSVGIAAFDNKRPAVDVVAEADRALYEAKAHGRDRWSMCTLLTAR